MVELLIRRTLRTTTYLNRWSIEVNRTLATGGHAKKPPSPGPLEMDAGRLSCSMEVWHFYAVVSDVFLIRQFLGQHV